jgi:dimethylargininase
LAKSQHHNYTQTLRSLIPTLHVISADERCPDSPFVETTAFIWNRKAIINNMVLEPYARKLEIGRLKKRLTKLNLSNICTLKSHIRLNGGDIIVTENEILVGISNKTNYCGLSALKEVHTDYIVRPILLTSNRSLLKSVMTPLDEETFVISDCPEGRQIMNQLKPTYQYKFVRVAPHHYAANVLRIKDTVLLPISSCQTNIQEPLFEMQLLKEIRKRNLNYKIINISEILKANGDLTCMSLLYH